MNSLSGKWIRERIRGFNEVSQEENEAIADFTLLWTLFEARVLATRGSPSLICDRVKEWNCSGSLDANAYDQELNYFRDRYVSGPYKKRIIPYCFAVP